MSGVQRWDVQGDFRVIEHPRGEYVTYADHVAALRACEARVREEAYNEVPAIAVYGERLRSEGYDVGHAAGMREALADFLTSIDEDDPVYLRGYAAALDAARDAVVAVSVGGQHFWSVGFRDGTTQALAAIDALEKP